MLHWKKTTGWIHPTRMRPTQTDLDRCVTYFIRQQVTNKAHKTPYPYENNDRFLLLIQTLERNGNSMPVVQYTTFDVCDLKTDWRTVRGLVTGDLSRYRSCCRHFTQIPLKKKFPAQRRREDSAQAIYGTFSPPGRTLTHALLLVGSRIHRFPCRNMPHLRY